MDNKSRYYEKAYNTRDCEAEPIEKIIRIQASGSVLCCDLDFSKWHYKSSDINLDNKSISVKNFLGRYIEKLPKAEDGSQLISSDIIPGKDFTFHLRDDHWVIEIELVNLSNQNAVEERLYQRSLLSIVYSNTTERFSRCNS